MTTHTVDAPGAILTYDVREPESPGDAAPLMLIGSPMDASGFVTLASHFPDRTVVTYDPRGTARSKRTDDAPTTSPTEHADDLHLVIEALGRGPVDLFASSGGAVNALVLVERHPEDVRTLVAHEPPAGEVLPDREEAAAAARTIHETYQRDGYGPAMAKFIALVMHKGPIPAGLLDGPGPDPANFGLPVEDDGRRDDPLLGQNIVSGTGFTHDFDAVRAAPTRVIVAVGEESDGEMAHRGGLGVAERLGEDAVVFPSNHAGFLGGEFGQTGKPAEFAAKLREVLGA